MIGPIEMPKRRSPTRTPNATAPIRTRRYSAGVTFRPARARSSVSVGLPLALRLWLRLSAAGRSSLSTSSRGVARGAATTSGRAIRSLRIRSRLQKKTTIAPAIGMATMTRGGRFMVPRSLEKRRVGRLDHLERHSLGCRNGGACRVWALGARKVVVKRLEDILQRRVIEEPCDHLGLALGHDDCEAGRVRGVTTRERGGSHPDHVQVGKDGLGRHLARGGDRSDHRDVVLRLDVVGDTLLLARWDGHPPLTAPAPAD